MHVVSRAATKPVFLDNFTPSTMPPLVALPSRSDAFSDYRPSRNAHTDLLTNKRSGGRIVKIGLNSELRGVWTLADFRRRRHQCVAQGPFNINLEHSARTAAATVLPQDQ